MSITLREFMTARRAEIQSQIKALKEEMREIDAAFAALPQEGSVKATRERGSTGSGKKTLKELALEALRENPEGMEAVGIIKWIKDKYDLDVARESMSPQLSRLGQEGVIKRDGLTWRRQKSTIELIGDAAATFAKVAEEAHKLKTASSDEEEAE